jgi:phosphatidylserine/phosphatidylglycerophosphate/cardiolipin synthase-like enzyme
MPDPFWEHGIVESWLNAVAKADKYILIEDQYWRAPILTEAILRRMAQVPTLQLVVITKPINEWTDPGCAWSYRTDTQLETAVPGRYHLLQLRAFDHVVTWGFDETEARFADIDVHSKLLVVDDLFLSVGSANKNNRGLIYEGEMAMAVKDAAFVRDVRRRILQNILGPGVVVSDDVTQWKNQLLNAASWNDAVWNAWDAEGGDISLDGAPLPAAYAPRGFVYSLDFRTVDDCFLEDVGPDMT